MKLPKIENYGGLLLASQIIRWFALILAPIHVIAHLGSWYADMFSESMKRVEGAATSTGIVTQLIALLMIVGAYGLLYVLGECIDAFRDIVINSRHRS